MNKHAYLIIAHKLNKTFEILLEMLDYQKNDIFIHVDKKSGFFNEDYFKEKLRYSNVFFTKKRINVQWGGYSQIEAELILLDEATKNSHYYYYHLLSGEDLPIKSQQYIHYFFETNGGKQFINFQDINFDYYDRVYYRYFFQEYVGRNRRHPLYVINAAIVACQKFLGIKRNKSINFQKGTNWFSITDDLARYVISKKEWIKKTFKYTKCCDEIFLHTIVHNSFYKNQLYHREYDNDLSSMQRLIDWNRGLPYTFRREDFEELMNSKMLFARKFNFDEDKDIILMIKNEILKYKSN